MASSLKKIEAKLEILTDIYVLIKVEKWIRGICHPMHRYAKASNKYMKDYNENTQPAHELHGTLACQYKNWWFN